MENNSEISFEIDYLNESLEKDTWLNISLPDQIRDSFTSIFKELHEGNNPYVADENIVLQSAFLLYDLINKYYIKYGDIEIAKLLQTIKSASSGNNLPLILIRNGPTEPKGSLIPPPLERGFEYGSNEKDRMKKYFYAEWFAWTIATLFNHDNIIHPSEHGGKNRFHSVSPKPLGDSTLRNVGASTGGGDFQLHNDSTIYNSFDSKHAFLEELKRLNTSIETVVQKCRLVIKNISEEDVFSQVFCGKYVCVDALTLTGILNVKTQTNIGTPHQLQKHLQSKGMSNKDIQTLSKMPVAHFAGPADGDISNNLGTVAPPIFVNEDGEIIGTYLNAAKDRMLYVGKDPLEEVLFSTFVKAIRSMRTHKFLVLPGDLLFIANTVHGLQQSLTHGRDALGEEEYNINIGKKQPGRRNQSRQYLISRHKNSQESFVNRYTKSRLGEFPFRSNIK